MKKRFKVCCIGLGHRGMCYLERMFLQKDRYELVAVCDINHERVRQAKEQFQLKDENCFYEENEFFAKNRGDILIVATQDRDHVGHCIKALKLGYDILCEKPISGVKEEVEELLKAHRKYGHKIFVCHVLRFAPAFRRVKDLLDAGKIGQLVMIDSIENVGYLHQAHSFVRGNWRKSEETSPMILAKCCHDLDLLVWYSGSKCESLNSRGDLRYFKKENQPEGASDRCQNCKYRGQCPYDAYEAYLVHNFWGKKMITDVRPITDEAIIDALDHGPYGRCVFACDNDVVDNEMTIMRFQNGVTANLRMTAFTYGGGRIMKFYGTLGEIDLDEEAGRINIMEFGKKKETIEISTLVDAVSGHGGGDDGLINALYDFIVSDKPGGTTLEASMESHLMAFAAEESRLHNGATETIEHK